MRFLVFVPQARWDIGVNNWLLAHIGGQGILWKVEIDSWERRLVFFMNESDSLLFKKEFNL